MECFFIRALWDIIRVAWGGCTPCCFMPLVAVCYCTYLCASVHALRMACFPKRACALGLDVHAHVCDGTMQRAFQTASTPFRKVPEWVCLRECKLEEKGDCRERETFPRQPGSVRLIKSHSSNEGLETKAELAGGALDDRKENFRKKKREKKKQRASIRMTDCHVCAYLYLTLESHAGTGAYQPASHRPTAQLPQPAAT